MPNFVADVFESTDFEDTKSSMNSTREHGRAVEKANRILTSVSSALNSDVLQRYTMICYNDMNILTPAMKDSETP
jgi:hypothetical protein